MHEGTQFLVKLLVVYVELRVGVCKFDDGKVMVQYITKNWSLYNRKFRQRAVDKSIIYISKSRWLHGKKLMSTVIAKL